MRHIARLVVICVTVLRYGLDELALSSFRQPWVRFLVRVITLGRTLDAPRGVRLRLGLEKLGPIFVKFGQVLSTRRDLLPQDIADELSLLQDRVPDPVAEYEPPVVEPDEPAFAWGQPSSREALVERASDDRRPGETWVERAYRGPTADNPSLSLRKRLKRAAFFDQRDRDAAANLAARVEADAGLPERVAEREFEAA